MAKRDRVAAIGVGYSDTGRWLGLSRRELAAQAGVAAMNDCGITADQIDGVVLHAGIAGAEPPGLDRTDAIDVGQMLGIKQLNYYNADEMGPAYVHAAISAIAAIQSGMAHTVLTMRVINQRLNTRQLSAEMSQPTYVGGDAQFVMPFGSLNGPNNIGALPAQRHMELYGTTEEQFGAHVIAQRAHAALNDEAILRDPLTMDDYLNSRYVSKPMRLLDCDYPVDSASAIIFTTEERARDFKKKPIFVEAAAHSATEVLGGGFEKIADMNHNSPYHAAKTLWSRTDLKPSDVDCAQLYDGFTIIVFQWLEALGFCGEGESGPFVASGATALGGSLPVNTDGGACNVGRRHGANFCIESVRQLRGNESGARQVKDAKAAVWANAVGPFSGAFLMTAD
ncbi:MAG: thiolase family protein [Actinomycetota bacterium]|nr:thiolase family protein [Actinomycetota bacterium]